MAGCTEGRARAGTAWFVRGDPQALARLTLEFRGPSGDRSFAIRAPEVSGTSQGAGDVTLDVRSASMSRAGRSLLATLELSNESVESATSIYATSTHVFDLEGGRVGKIESGSVTSFTMDGEAVVYEDAGGALSFVGVGRDDIWETHASHGGLKARKFESTQGWAWWASAPGSPIVFAYDRAAGSIRRFDYGQIASGVVSELAGVEVASPSPGPETMAACAEMSRSGGGCFDRRFISTSDASLLLRRRTSGDLELWDAAEGGDFVLKGLPATLGEGWAVVSGLGASSAVLWHGQTQEFCVWNLRSNRTRRFPALGVGPWYGTWTASGEAFTVAAVGGALVRFSEDAIDVISVAQTGCASPVGDTIAFGPEGHRASWSCSFDQFGQSGTQLSTWLRVGPEGLFTSTGTMMLPLSIAADGDVVAYSASSLGAAQASETTSPRSLYILDPEDEIRRISDLEPTPLLLFRAAGYLEGEGSPAYVLSAPR